MTTAPAGTIAPPCGFITGSTTVAVKRVPGGVSRPRGWLIFTSSREPVARRPPVTTCAASGG
jgi:hypothetical protein